LTGTQLLLLALTIGVVLVAVAIASFAVQLHYLNRTVEIFYRQQLDMANILKELGEKH
jgi:hypothetical protein